MDLAPPGTSGIPEILGLKVPPELELRASFEMDRIAGTLKGIVALGLVRRVEVKLDEALRIGIEVGRE